RRVPVLLPLTARLGNGVEGERPRHGPRSVSQRGDALVTSVVDQHLDQEPRVGHHEGDEQRDERQALAGGVALHHVSSLLARSLCSVAGASYVGLGAPTSAPKGPIDLPLEGRRGGNVAWCPDARQRAPTAQGLACTVRMFAIDQSEA